MQLSEIITHYKSWQDQNVTSLETDVNLGLKKAAVLVPLIVHDHGIHILLNKRSEHLPNHAGQICFPGGHIDPKDQTPIETALREAEEEIALPREKVTVIGTLNQCKTITGFQITPVLAHIDPPLDLKPDPLEVSDYFEVPLSFILNPNHIKQQKITSNVENYFFFVIEFAHYRIWGATASILVNLAQVLQHDHKNY